MNGITPNCLNDFLFSNPTDRDKLELILARKLPFPFGGKSGILLHGTWGTGKSTLAQLLPGLLESAHSGEWDMTQGVGQMPTPEPDHCQTKVFRCGGGLSSTVITQTISNANLHFPLWHYTQHDYFILDELDKLTLSAQQSLLSKMDLKRCMYFFTTNYLAKIDNGIVNRCHLVEMNQVNTPSAYLTLAYNLLEKMGVGTGVVNDTTLIGLATKSRGSLRDFTTDIVIHGVAAGGVLQKY